MDNSEDIKNNAKKVWSGFAPLENLTGTAAPRLIKFANDFKVDNPNKIIINDSFWSEVTDVESSLGETGRVLIRPSGTEPLIRIMVESEDSTKSENLCNSLAELALKI